MSKLLNNNIKQLNIGDVQGTLYNSFNCDLSFNKGKISISPRTRITTNTITDLGTASGFAYFDGYYWTVAGTHVFKATDPQDTFVKDASNSGEYFPPADCDSAYSDITVFNGNLIVSTKTKIYRKIANGLGTGGWYVIDTSLSTTVVRPVTVYNNRLYWTRLPYTIVSCDTSYAISDTSSATHNLTLPSSNEILFIKPHSVGLYIGVTKNDATEGYVYDWNGETKNTFRSQYNIYAQGALAAYVDNRVFYVVNSNAELLQFNGGSFTMVARLPIKRDSLYRANATGSLGNTKFIHPNGLTLIDGIPCMLINAKNNNDSLSLDENIHSGIWEFDVNTQSLYHKYSMSLKTRLGNISDYGQISVNAVGALANIPDLSTADDIEKGNFLAGVSFYSDATTVGYGIFTDNYYDTEEKAGFFSTVQIRTDKYQDMWNSITALYSPSESMSFVFKYRTRRTNHTDFTMTWASTSSFTTTQTGIVEGDEITIIQGKGSGRIAHVSSVTFSSPNYTVNLDETITNVTGTGKARVQKWKKLGTINNVNNFFQNIGINTPSTLIELKCAIVAIGEATVDELILENKINK